MITVVSLDNKLMIYPLYQGILRYHVTFIQKMKLQMFA